MNSKNDTHVLEIITRSDKNLEDHVVEVEKEAKVEQPNVKK